MRRIERTVEDFGLSILLGILLVCAGVAVVQAAWELLLGAWILIMEVVT